MSTYHPYYWDTYISSTAANSSGSGNIISNKIPGVKVKEIEKEEEEDKKQYFMFDVKDLDI